jgi:hypothetical protein
MLVSTGLLYDLGVLFFMGVVLLFIVYFKHVQPILRAAEKGEVTFTQ